MTEPVRIAQVMGKMDGGGVEAVVMNYFKHIDRDRFQFDFIVNDGSTHIPRKEIEELGGRVFVIPGYTHQLAYQKELRRLFEKNGYEIVHSHINALSVLSLHAAHKAKIPIRIAHSHNTAGAGETVRNILKNILRKFANKYPTHRFACGELAGRWLFGDEDFEIIHNAIELDTYAFDPDIRTQVRNDLDLDDDVFVIGHIGRFAAQKNHTFLIEAFARLCDVRGDCVLVCVGEGPLFEDVQNKVAELSIDDKVRFLGQRSDAPRLYQAFDVFVLPSLYEGLCVVGVEAQRSGVMCYMSDQITREISITDHVRYLPIEDPQVWADELVTYDTAEHPLDDRVMNDADFDDYNIVEAAKKLADRYQAMYDSLRETTAKADDGE